MKATPAPNDIPLSVTGCVADHDPLGFLWKSAHVSGLDAVCARRSAWASAADTEASKIKLAVTIWGKSAGEDVDRLDFGVLLPDIGAH